MSSEIKIPIYNIYYLLCYAWNKLVERDIVDVSGIDSTNVLDLFAQVLVGGLNHLIKQGLDRGYVNFNEATRCLRGKVNFSLTAKKNLLVNAKVYCEYDELSHDILHNRILKATIRSLITTESLDTGLKDQLVGFYRKLHEIEDIQLNSKLFSLIQLHRNNSFYDFLIKICDLIYNNLLVSEDTGKSKFRDFIQDERQMAGLFEEFVRNLYEIERPDCNVDRDRFFWQAKALDDLSKRYMPKQITDISIIKDDKKVVIDTKYYKEALVEGLGKPKLRPLHIRQLEGYLGDLELQGGVNKHSTGVLLYPTVKEPLELNYKKKDHMILVRTINLDQNWKDIEKDLFKILDDSLLAQNLLGGTKN
jgi:5-methylcytosine-specific restriction enzyme subunit McrC